MPRCHQLQNAHQRSGQARLGRHVALPQTGVDSPLITIHISIKLRKYPIQTQQDVNLNKIIFPSTQVATARRLYHGLKEK
jgi:hypothetical protein